MIEFVSLLAIEQKEVPKTKLKGVNFEEAISETGIGKFHWLLFLSLIPVSWATNIDTANISMILTPAECDLKLTLLHKGILNAGIYAGKNCKQFSIKIAPNKKTFLMKQNFHF